MLLVKVIYRSSESIVIIIPFLEPYYSFLSYFATELNKLYNFSIKYYYNIELKVLP